ncbi:MAG: hypothetical protein JXA42_00875, partial [Anaerolineales bacterium]|nr:hypothetical protein [Anaerolineales bacterium]
VNGTTAQSGGLRYRAGPVRKGACVLFFYQRSLGHMIQAAGIGNTIHLDLHPHMHRGHTGRIDHSSACNGIEKGSSRVRNF